MANLCKIGKVVKASAGIVEINCEGEIHIFYRDFPNNLQINDQVKLFGGPNNLRIIKIENK